MAPNSAIVKAQVDANLKRNAEITFRMLGLDMTSAIRMFLSQVVLREAIPFDVAVPQPNRTTVDAAADSFSGDVQDATSVEHIFANARKSNRRTHR